MRRIIIVFIALIGLGCPLEEPAYADNSHLRPIATALHNEEAAKKLTALATAVPNSNEGGQLDDAMRRLDEATDALLKNDIATCKVILVSKEYWIAASVIIERLMVPEAAANINENNLGELLDIAEQNPFMANRARAIRAMAGDIKAGRFTPFTLPDTLEPSQRPHRPLTPGIEIMPKSEDPELTGRITRGNQAKTDIKFPRTAIFEQHPNATQYFLVVEGELIVLAAPAAGNRAVRAYVLGKGDIVKIDTHVYHMTVNRTAVVKLFVFNEDPAQPGKKVDTNQVRDRMIFTCIGSSFQEEFAPQSARPVLRPPAAGDAGI
ncbi:MAG: hypothetical protein HY589_01150 [Candidatus Omnitrophica bacterium]|nr:hypothetical protein [Candidatus Omnitrophota bacterium]